MSFASSARYLVGGVRFIERTELMYQRIHYSKLAHLAERKDLKPNRLYLKCYGSMRTCVKFKTTGVFLISNDEGNVLEGLAQWKDRAYGERKCWRYWEITKWTRYNKTFKRLVYAGDSGMWELPGEYHNKDNYILDIKKLREEHGIIVEGA